VNVSGSVKGINLANIVKDLRINEETGQPILNESIEKLKDLVKKDAVDSIELLIETMELINLECKKVCRKFRIKEKLNIILFCFLTIVNTP